MRRYRIRPSKESRPFRAGFSILYTIIGCGFVVIGITQVVPGAGLFGLLWTGMALCFTIFGIFSLVQTVKGRDSTGLYGIEIAEEDAAKGSAEARLQELRSLYDRSLITEEEYEEKRREILKDL